MERRIQPRPLSGRIRAIPSKSDVQRALFAAALCKEETEIVFSESSADIGTALSMLRALGVSVLQTDTGVRLRGGLASGAAVRLFAGSNATAARMLLPVAAAHFDRVTLSGDPQLSRRPFAPLTAALTGHGALCDREELPVMTNGRLQSGVFSIRGDVSSQYISGLLFALPTLCGDSEILLTSPAVSHGYLQMTLETLARFGIEVTETEKGWRIPGGQTYASPGRYTPEGDWSAAAYWLAAGALYGSVTVDGLSEDSRQPDRAILEVLRKIGADVRTEKSRVTVSRGEFRAFTYDGSDTPDILPLVCCIAALCGGESRIAGANRLVYKESDRAASTLGLLRALGGEITLSGDVFTVRGRPHLHGGCARSYADHRMAMCAGLLAGALDGELLLSGAEAVEKSYPAFWEDFEKLGGAADALR